MDREVAPGVFVALCSRPRAYIDSYRSDMPKTGLLKAFGDEGDVVVDLLDARQHFASCELGRIQVARLDGGKPWYPFKCNMMDD